MPTYTIRDPQTGKTVTLKGDSPPTEAELTDIFAKLGDGTTAAPEQPKQEPAGDWSVRGGKVYRPDGSEMDAPLLGVPMMPGAGAGRAVLSRGAGLAQRAVSGAKSLAAQAMPAAKYEGVKYGLESVGVPPVLAMPAAAFVSGYKRGAKPATSPAASAPASPASPVASRPAPPTPQAAPSAAGSVPSPQAASMPQTVMSPQRIQNELGLAARRLNVKLSDEEFAAAAKVVKETGQAPKDVIAALKQLQPAPATAARQKMTAAETREYVRLRSNGKSDREAAESIAASRQLSQTFGTPSPEQARQAVAQRNADGRWGDKR